MPNNNIQIPSNNHIEKYDNNTRDHIYRSITSYGHIMGSVTSIVVDYIRSAFNNNYIKAVWNTLEVPYSQRMNGFRDFMNKPKPLMTIDPRFDPSSESSFMPQSEFDYEIVNDTKDDTWIGLYNSMVISYWDNYMLCVKPRRYKMDFTVNFIFDSDTQRIQAQEYIRQNIRHKYTNTVKRYIENNIPFSFMKTIADINNIDYKSDEFMRLVNVSTNIPITKRIRTGSQTMEFFALEKVPVDITFNGAPSSNGPMKKGNIVVSSSFSEDITVEFVAYSLYFLKTNKDMGAVIDPSDTLNQPTTMTGVGIDNLYLIETPIIPKVEDDFLKFKTITVQADKNGDDTLDINEIISNAEISSVIKYYRSQNKTIDFIKIYAYENEHKLDNIRLDFDLSNLTLTIKDMDIYKNYYITIYINRIIIGNLKTELFEWDDFNRVNRRIDEK
jgi:hypothetical protein